MTLDDVLKLKEQGYTADEIAKLSTVISDDDASKAADNTQTVLKEMSEQLADMKKQLEQANSELAKATRPPEAPENIMLRDYMANINAMPNSAPVNDDDMSSASDKALASIIAPMSRPIPGVNENYVAYKQ